MQIVHSHRVSRWRRPLNVSVMIRSEHAVFLSSVPCDWTERAARPRLHHVAFKTSSNLGFVKTPMTLLTSDLVTHPHAHTARHRLPDAGERRQVTISYSASQDEGSPQEHAQESVRTRRNDADAHRSSRRKATIDARDSVRLCDCRVRLFVLSHSSSQHKIGSQSHKSSVCPGLAVQERLTCP